MINVLENQWLSVTSNTEKKLVSNQSNRWQHWDSPHIALFSRLHSDPDLVNRIRYESKHGRDHLTLHKPEFVLL